MQVQAAVSVRAAAAFHFVNPERSAISVLD
jgi:hypothetical protein